MKDVFFFDFRDFQISSFIVNNLEYARSWWNFKNRDGKYENRDRKIQNRDSK